MNFCYFILKLRVRAVDDGQPPKENVTTVTFTISHNLYAPTIDTPNVNARIPETQDLGNSIAQVKASDRDTLVSCMVVRIILLIYLYHLGRASISFLMLGMVMHSGLFSSCLNINIT